MPAKHDIRFTWKTERSSYSDCETFRAHINYMLTEPEYASQTPGLRNPVAWDHNGLAHLADLCITAQRNLGSTDDRQWYGFALEYRDVHAVDADRLEIMTKGLRSITRKMDKLETQFGHAQDLATFCSRVAAAIGTTDAHPFGEYRSEITYNGTHYRWTDVDGLRYALERAVSNV